jgi:hypothetical protein
MSTMHVNITTEPLVKTCPLPSRWGQVPCPRPSPGAGEVSRSGDWDLRDRARPSLERNLGLGFTCREAVGHLEGYLVVVG